MTEQQAISVKVAEEVMGWKLVNCETDEPAANPADYDDAMTNDGWAWEGCLTDGYAWQWRPMQKLADAFQVLDQVINAMPDTSTFRIDGIFPGSGDTPQFRCEFREFWDGGPHPLAEGEGDTVNEAICNAALAAMKRLRPQKA